MSHVLVADKNNSSFIESVSVLLHVAIGCPQLAPPIGGWAKQTNDIAVLGCSASPETWQLICHGATWIGVTQNCSEGRIHVEGKLSPRNRLHC